MQFRYYAALFVFRYHRVQTRTFKYLQIFVTKPLRLLHMFDILPYLRILFRCTELNLTEIIFLLSEFIKIAKFVLGMENNLNLPLLVTRKIRSH